MKKEYLIKRLFEVVGYLTEYDHTSDVWDYIQAIEILKNLISELSNGDD